MTHRTLLVPMMLVGAALLFAVIPTPGASALAGCVTGDTICTCVSNIPSGNSCSDSRTGQSCGASTGPSQEDQIGFICN